MIIGSATKIVIIKLIVPLLELVSKVYKFKICLMRTERLGHLALNTQVFFIRHKRQLIEDLNYYLISPSLNSSNMANNDLLLLYIEYSKTLSNVRIIRSSSLFFFFSYARSIFDGKGFFYYLEYKSNESEFLFAEQIVSLSESQKCLGNEILLKMGITDNDKIVSIYTRDSRFLDNFDNQRDWSYHNYRDTNINNYLKAIKYLVEEGFTVVRIGSEYSKSLKFTNGKYIEYNLSDYKSSFMDLYLPYISRFMIGNKSGPEGLALIFNTPLLVTDLTAFMELALGKNDLFIQKKIIDLKGNIVPFKEVITNEKYYTPDGNKMKSLYGLTYLENTPDEILDATIEMYNKLSDNLTLKLTQVDLLNRYHNEYCKKNKFTTRPAPLSVTWLEKNYHLYLED